MKRTFDFLDSVLTSPSPSFSGGELRKKWTVNGRSPFILLLLLFLLMFSCGSKTDELTPIIGPEKAQFRGNSIGDKYENVLKNAQRDNAVPSDEGVLTCEFKVDDSDLMVRYEFDQQELYAIQADIFFADTATLNSFEKNLVERYNKQFGEVEIDGGFLVWKQRQSGTEVEYALADESIEFGQPKLSLTIYNFD
ncbi:MAG: hypothetical protein GC178_06945 [Flavobacteriales bacterium]|nr:hypothetical protein [Flavobacteriales bacterium]